MKTYLSKHYFMVYQNILANSFPPLPQWKSSVTELQTLHIWTIPYENSFKISYDFQESVKIAPYISTVPAISQQLEFIRVALQKLYNFIKGNVGPCSFFPEE